MRDVGLMPDERDERILAVRRQAREEILRLPSREPGVLDGGHVAPGFRGDLRGFERPRQGTREERIRPRQDARQSPGGLPEPLASAGREWAIPIIDVRSAGGDGDGVTHDEHLHTRHRHTTTRRAARSTRARIDRPPRPADKRRCLLYQWIGFGSVIADMNMEPKGRRSGLKPRRLPRTSGEAVG